MDAGIVAAGVNPVAMIGSAAMMGGQIYQNNENRKLMNDQNNFNTEQTHEQMAWQERLSSTAHQREVKDLIAAGINPILSANGGASTPSGSAATSADADVGNPTAGLVTTAMEAMQMRKSLEKADSEIALLKSQKTKTDVDAKVASQGVPKADISNRIYNLAEPGLRKLEEAFGTRPPTDSMRRGSENGQKFFKLSPGFHNK